MARSWQPACAATPRRARSRGHENAQADPLSSRPRRGIPVVTSALGPFGSIALLLATGRAFEPTTRSIRARSPARSTRSPPGKTGKTEFTLLPGVGGRHRDIGVGGGFFMTLTRLQAGYVPYVWNLEGAWIATGIVQDGRVKVPYNDGYPEAHHRPIPRRARPRRHPPIVHGRTKRSSTTTAWGTPRTRHPPSGQPIHYFSRTAASTTSALPRPRVPHPGPSLGHPDAPVHGLGAQHHRRHEARRRSRQRQRRSQETHRPGYREAFNRSPFSATRSRSTRATTRFLRTAAPGTRRA